MTTKREMTAETQTKALQAKASSVDVDGLINAASLDWAGPSALAKITARCREMPQTCRKNYVKAMKGKGLRASIKAFCMECVGWERLAVTECTAPACPLYPVRPFQTK